MPGVRPHPVADAALSPAPRRLCAAAKADRVIRVVVGTFRERMQHMRALVIDDSRTVRAIIGTILKEMSIDDHHFAVEILKGA